MRRLFIIRKDLKLRPGKLAAMVGHCCEAYWTNAMKAGKAKDNEFDTLPAVETYADGRKGPALYKHPAVFEMSKKAFEAGEKNFKFRPEGSRPTVTVSFEIPKDVWDEYVNDIFTKTVCEARNLMVKNNRYEDAIRHLQISQKSPKDRIESLYLLAKCFIAKGQADLGIMQLETALSQLPTMNELKKKVMYQLGLCAEDVGEDEKAYAYYRDVYAADIGFADLNTRMMVLDKMIKKRKAESNR